LVSFTAVYSNGAANLTWFASNEQNLDRYEVQKSLDGNGFTTIGTVKATGNGQLSSQYYFTDVAPGNGIVYYRLKPTDTDGSYKYSNVVVLKISVPVVGSIKPNPFTDEVTVSVELAKKQMVTIALLDASGKQVYGYKTAGAKGLNSIRVNSLGHLAKGLYTIIVHTEEQSVQQKLVKSGNH